MNIVLYHPQIPQNTGNIGRLCVGVGARLHLVKPYGFELTEKKVRRAGLDYWPHLDYIEMDEWDPSEVEDGNRVFLMTKFAELSIFDLTFKKGDWFVFGAETVGLPEKMRKEHSEKCVKLPMEGPIRSQNLANAVSAVSYLALKDIHFSEI